jgi:hypothetical protein
MALNVSNMQDWKGIQKTTGDVYSTQIHVTIHETPVEFYSNILYKYSTLHNLTEHPIS